MKVRMVTLGCKVNQVESQALAQLFEREGYTVVHDGEADVVVVNSCTVTAEADRKTRQTLRRLRRENPASVLVLTGCMPQAAPQAAADLPEADLVTGTRERAEIPALVREFLATGERQVRVTRHESGDCFEQALDAERFDKSFQKAYLKIEDGCDRGCSYCIIPRARGRVRSLPPHEVAERAARLAANGYREIILTGINLSRYGADMGCCLADAVEAVNALPGDFRIRLGSLESDIITAEQWRRFAACDRLCPQFHLALQSGCDATLARMHRRYTTAQYLAAVQTARELFPDAGITTDIIVGFPGESEEEFAETCRFVSSLGLLRAHIFVYSARPGTPAAAMPQVDPVVRRTRARHLEAIAAQSAADIARAHIGSTVQVLCEANGSGFAANGLEVRCPAAAPVGQLCGMRIVDADGAAAIGEII